MATLIATRGGQSTIVAEFIWNFDDAMLDTSGNLIDFGETDVAAAHTFDIIPLPPGAIVLSGQVTRYTAFDTAGYDIIIGDSATANRYMASADLKAAGITSITPTGYVSLGESIRMSVQSDDVCTTGVASVRIEYIVRGRQNENQM